MGSQNSFARMILWIGYSILMKKVKRKELASAKAAFLFINIGRFGKIHTSHCIIDKDQYHLQ